MAEECLVIRPGLVNARDRFARDNQNMRRGSGRDVAKRHNLLVLIHNVGRDFLVADFLEQCLFHWSTAKASLKMALNSSQTVDLNVDLST